jgi:pyrroloquinoline quinone biosynthesis protein B
MQIHVLGSAAGGGFPQWNCNCRGCAGVRNGTLRASPRTQSSIAVSSDGLSWVLLNASPDILSQIRAFPALQPARAPRDTGIVGIVLMDAQIDHTTGLLSLREGKTLNLYCSEQVRSELETTNPLLTILGHYCQINMHCVDPHGSAFRVSGAENLLFQAFPVVGKAPPYSPHRQAQREGDNLGLLITDTRTSQTLFYAPGLAQITPPILAAMATADCLLVDGTTWTDDEMITQGLSNKRAQDMGHLPQSGPGGMIEILQPLKRPRKILIHINNTNPILDEDSPERAELTRQGIEVAYDGMEILL